MTHPNRRAQEVEIEARRARVASLLLAGVSDQTRIAESVGVDRSTISRDIKHIEKQWQAAAVQDIAAAKGKDLERTDRLIAGLWDKARGGQGRPGNERAAKMVLDLMQHRAKLLGLNAPDRIEDNRTVTIHLLAESMAEQSGLDKDEVLAEAQRILAEANR